MKTYTKILTLLAAAMLFATGCINEDPAYLGESEPTAPGENIGTLKLNGLNMRILFDTQTDTGNEDTGGETGRPTSRTTRAEIDTDDYIVEILDAENISVLRKTYGEMKSILSEPMSLAVGSYKLVIRSEENYPATAWEHPVYGAEKSFSILKAQTTSIGEVVCTLQNIKVTFMGSKDLMDKLTDDTKAVISLGENKVEFAKGETRAAYFLPLEELNKLTMQLSGKFVDTGADASFTKSISNVKAGQWRKITLVISYADKGNIKFDIKVDSFIQDEEIVINGTEGLWEEIYTEEPVIDPTAPTITWVDHDISKPFHLMASMFQDGKCTEPFKFDLVSPNGIESFIVEISSTNSDFMQSLVDSELPTTFDLCKVTPTHPAYTLLAAFGFPLGDEVKNVKAASFDIAGAMPLLYNRPGFDGTHTFAFTIADINGKQTPAALQIVVDRNNENVDPAIIWKGYDIDKQHDLVGDMLIDIDITAPAGIKNLVVTIISETLDLDGILPSSFDLANITDPELAKSLGKDGGLGFPINDEVKDKTAIPFSITSFGGLLMNFEGLHEFKLDVTDNNDTTVTKSIKLFVNKVQ